MRSFAEQMLHLLAQRHQPDAMAGSINVDGGEALATYLGWAIPWGTPVSLVWQSWGHSDSSPVAGELDLRHPAESYQGRQALAWFEHYVRGTGPAPELIVPAASGREPSAGEGCGRKGHGRGRRAASPGALVHRGAFGPPQWQRRASCSARAWARCR